jgi:hypothetical protein
MQSCSEKFNDTIGWFLTSFLMRNGRARAWQPREDKALLWCYGEASNHGKIIPSAPQVREFAKERNLIVDRTDRAVDERIKNLRSKLLKTSSESRTELFATPLSESEESEENISREKVHFELGEVDEGPLEKSEAQTEAETESEVPLNALDGFDYERGKYIWQEDSELSGTETFRFDLRYD